MPSYWTSIPSSPPQQRRNDVATLCRTHGARLAENQTYYGADGKTCYALIVVPDGYDPTDLFADLGAIEWTAHVDADEKANGMQPPPSGCAPPGGLLDLDEGE